MRFVFFIVLIANVVLLAYGQGFFGIPPAEQGREPQSFAQRNQQAVIPGEPR